MTAGAKIAAKVKRGLVKAGVKTGAGALSCVIRRVTGGAATPWGTGTETTTYYTATALDTETRMRDASGTLIETTERVLMVDATGVVPLKSDQIAVGYSVGASVPAAAWLQIVDVLTIAPTGVPLMFEVRLAK